MIPLHIAGADDVPSQTAEDLSVGDAIARLRDNAPDRRAPWEKRELKARLLGDPVPPRRIGRYSVGSCLGAGGMGEVYAGYDEALDRKIALKLLHPHRADEDARVGDASQSRVRVLREAKTLAKLSHPNVVHVYEVGETEGRIFIAMEFIAGTTMRQWLASEDRSWREVLAHYLAAGRGLAAVHRAGMIHRDFKPDNVLLGEDGRVCVADFGLARPVAPQASMEGSTASSGTRDGPMQITRTSHIAGTPAYMAPEQLHGKAVGAHSDQFGFCVALYEGLYGCAPFPGATVGAKLIAMDAGATAPPRRSKVPRRLWRALARGLAVDPKARFASLDTLLHALDPVRARRRRALAVGGLAVVGGAAALVVATQPPDPCPLPSNDTLGWGAEDRARVDEGLRNTGLVYAGTTAQAVLEKLDERVGTLAQAQQQTCEATHLRHVQSEDLLDQRMFCLEGIAGRLHGVVDALAQADAEAVDHAVAVVEQLPRSQMCTAETTVYGMAPPASPEQAVAVTEGRSRLAATRATFELGDAPRAHEELSSLQATIEAVAYTPLTAELRDLQGRVAQRMGDPVAAAQLLIQAGELADGSRHDVLAAEIWNKLTLIGYRDLTPQDAARWLPHARAAVHRIGSPPRLRTTISRHEGHLAIHQGQLERARALLTEVLEQRRTQGDPLAIASAAGSLASLYKLIDEPVATLALHKQQRRIYAQHLGFTHPRMAEAEYNLGATLVALGREQEARMHLESALTLWTERYGPHHLDLALVHIALQQVEQTVGTVDQMLHHAVEARRIRRASLPADHIHVAEAEMVVGMSRLFRGDLVEATEAYRTAWEGLRATLGDDDPRSALARANLAEALLLLGRHDEAEAHAKAAWRVLQGKLPDHPASANTLKVLGQLALATGDLTAASTDLRRALELVESADTELPLERGDIMLSLSRALAASNRLDAARTMASAAEHAFARSPGEVAQHGATRARLQVVSLFDSNVAQREESLP